VVSKSTRLGLSWLSPDRVWADRLESMDLPGRDIPFFGVAVVFNDLLRTAYHRACVW
jgi:hypothetical protein